MYYVCVELVVFFFKQKTAYEMRISDWSSDVCSSDLFVERSPLGSLRREPEAAHVTVPVIKVPEGAEQSTQAAFGRILLDLAKSGDPMADRIVTTSPDVTVSTNLGAFVNPRGLFRRRELKDVFASAKLPSAQNWSGNLVGQHIKLANADHNTFLMLSDLGLAAPFFGK